MDRFYFKKLEYRPRFSKETNCYLAELYFGGEHIASVGNQGVGGPDTFHARSNVTLQDCDQFVRDNYSLGTWPALEDEDADVTYIPDVESICDDLIDVSLSQKSLKRSLKTKIVFQHDDKIMEAKLRQRTHEKVTSLIKRQHPDAIILNDLDFKEAFQLVYPYLDSRAWGQ